MPIDDGSVPMMFTGIQILEPRILDYIPRGVFSHSTTDVYPQAIAKGEIIAAHVASGTWQELSTLKRYLDISVELLKEAGKIYVAGPDAVIDPEAIVNESIIWDRVVIGAGARLTRAVLADDVVIPSGEIVENAVVVLRKLVEGKIRPEKALPGHFQGENFVVPL